MGAVTTTAVAIAGFAYTAYAQGGASDSATTTALNLPSLSIPGPMQVITSSTLLVPGPMQQNISTITSSRTMPVVVNSTSTTAVSTSSSASSGSSSAGSTSASESTGSASSEGTTPTGASPTQGGGGGAAAGFFVGAGQIAMLGVGVGAALLV